MILLHFFYGLAFEGLGLAAYLQLRREGDFPLKKELPWLASFGFVGGAAGWLDMFLTSGTLDEIASGLSIVRIIVHLLTGLLLLRFGWGMLNNLNPLPAWSIFIPGILIVPIAFVITYAVTTFITPSPIAIPIEIWTRYLLYMPGSFLAGIGFLRQWYAQRKLGLYDVSNLMLGAGLAFLFEAVVMGLIVPAAPYGPASYYNYDRVIHNAFSGESIEVSEQYGLTAWLDYQSVLNTTGIPIEIWRLLSAVIVTYFVVKALDVFEAIRKRQMRELQEDRDHAQREAFEAQILARQTTENWTNALVNISRRIAELEHVDDILVYIVEIVQHLLRTNFVGVAIQSQENSSLELKCYSNGSSIHLVANVPVPVANLLIQDVMRSSSSYRSLGSETVEMFDGICFFTNELARAAVVVPLKLENTNIGALWIARFKDDPFSETDMIWLESMADQVAIAIQHGLMTSQLQSFSIVQERGRIAREMHDGLAQVLGYLNLQTQTLGSLLNQGKVDKLQAELTQMRQAIQTAHADVRENILSLRTTLAQEKGLEAAVQEYLTEFGIQMGIKTNFVFQVEGELNLSSIAEVQLTCILQEALTNIRKHAQALEVKVAIKKENHGDGNRIHMLIMDDGVGFQAAGSKRNFGLQTMQERAESVGGELFIKSGNGNGTRIECLLPCLQPERLQKQSVVLH
ncbi:MAG: GAF domain-containing protein [Anaerolineae bacterium]|jgi:signal transduction histidine kinase|nr:GAF domain-containing protein [Anaerolineae bacterium]